MMSAVTDKLRQDIAAITDQRVEQCLRSADTAAGKWMAEDPSLGIIQRLSNA